LYFDIYKSINRRNNNEIFTHEQHKHRLLFFQKAALNRIPSRHN
jgi:hypothetical protein